MIRLLNFWRDLDCVKTQPGKHKSTVVSDYMIEKQSGCSLFQSLQAETQPGDSRMTADDHSFICCFGPSASRTSSAAPTTARTRWTNGQPASWSAASLSLSNRAKPTNTSVGWRDTAWSFRVEKSDSPCLFQQWPAPSCRKPERASTRPTPATGTPAWMVGGRAWQNLFQ